MNDVFNQWLGVVPIAGPHTMGIAGTVDVLHLQLQTLTQA